LRSIFVNSFCYIVNEEVFFKMARNYVVTVNGKAYDVVVEEKGSVAPPISAAPLISAPAPVAAQVPAAAPAPAPVQAPAPTPAAPPVQAPAPVVSQAALADAVPVNSPMPGKIWKLHVKEGDQVSEGQLVLILEAMKMENELFAPKAGTVVKVNYKEGDSVNTGEALLLIA
jgi:glutaconyl-CoA decarboxylase